MLFILKQFTHSDSHQPSSPQVKICAFVHMQSDGVADGKEDWETVESEGPPATDHMPVPQQDQHCSLTSYLLSENV